MPFKFPLRFLLLLHKFAICTKSIKPCSTHQPVSASSNSTSRMNWVRDPLRHTKRSCCRSVRSDWIHLQRWQRRLEVLVRFLQKQWQTPQQGQPCSHRLYNNLRRNRLQLKLQKFTLFTAFLLSWCSGAGVLTPQ